jgi:dCMP deaminase
MNYQRLTLDETYLRMAHLWAHDRSHCVRKKVGALAVKDGQIIADGYNGMPKGYDNTCELPNGNTNPLVLHAESNLLAKIGKSTSSSVGATLYLTLSPCLDCAKMILQHEIARIVYAEEYRITDGLDLLRQCNVEVLHLPCKFPVYN